MNDSNNHNTKEQALSETEQLQRYYNLRASEYERIYDFDEPHRREELIEIERLVDKQFHDHTTLEIACGSGYWTELLSKVASSIHAIDGSKEMLDVARSKTYSHSNVTFEECSAYELAQREDEYDAALAGFWLSHVPKSKLELFLKGLHARLAPNSTVLFLDNNLVEGMGGELVAQVNTEDTYKNRVLSDGSEHVIIKNYFTTGQLRNLFSPYAQKLEITMGHWYWSVLYQTR